MGMGQLRLRKQVNLQEIRREIPGAKVYGENIIFMPNST